MSTADSSTYDSATAPGDWRRWAFVGVPAAIVLGVAYGPLLLEYFTGLWAREHYQHFPFVLGAFAWLLAARLWSGGPPPTGSPSVARRGAFIALGALAWMLLAAAYGAPSPWLAYLSFIVLAAAFIVWAGSWRSSTGLWGAWALLWLIMMPPRNRDQVLITMLQRLSSRASSFVLDAVGVEHLMAGNTLQLHSKRLFVSEACSGIISVMSIIACAVIYGVWRRHRAVHIVALAAAGVGWATLMNTLRISLIAIAYDRWDLDWTEGTPHEILSLCMFMLTFLALISTDTLLQGLTAPIGEAWEAVHAEAVRFGGRLVWLWDQLLTPSTPDDEIDDDARRFRSLAPPLLTGRQAAVLALPLLAFAALPSWHAVAGGNAAATESRLSTDDVQACIQRGLAADASTLPSRIGAAEQTDFAAHERTRDDLLGNYSRSFMFQDGRGTNYLVSCDFPYEGGWHELTVCYLGVGWDLDRRTVSADETTVAGVPWQRMEADFSKPEGVRAFLTVCAFDEAGHPIDLPTMSLVEDAWNALTKRRDVNHQIAFQVQVWTTAGGPIGDEERETARKLLFEARQKFRSLIVPHAAGTNANPATTP
jgi:exosortase